MSVYACMGCRCKCHVILDFGKRPSNVCIVFGTDNPPVWELLSGSYELIEKKPDYKAMIKHKQKGLFWQRSSIDKRMFASELCGYHRTTPFPFVSATGSHYDGFAPYELLDPNNIVYDKEADR